MVASIQYIEGTIASYEQASEANRHTPARKGNVIELDADVADDVMIAGDLHGHRANFNAIKKIADLDARPGRHLVLQEVCHGGPTYASNGGCMSHAMLEDIARLKQKFPDRVHFLMSNHELAELTDYPIVKGQKMLNLLFRYGLQEVYGPATEKVREAYTGFLASCPVAVRVAQTVLVCHSVPEDLAHRPFDVSVLDRSLEHADLREGGAVFRMVWGRDYTCENATTFARLVHADVLVHGHEPCHEGYKVPNETQVILDCCGQPAAYVILPAGGPLTHAQVVERIAMLP